MKSLPKPAAWEKMLLPALAVGLVLALWHYSVIWTGTKVFPSPASVALGLAALAQQHVLWNDIADSLRRVALGFGAAVLTGIPIGLALGWYPALNQVVNPVVQILRPISPIAWIPVSILLFGVGDGAAGFLIFLAAFFPILISCTGSVSSVPSIYRRAGRNFGLSPLRVLTRVVFPAALPQILVGLRIALGVAWLVVVAAEMIAVNSGLGYLIIDARNAGKRYDLIVAGMVIIGLIGLVLDLLVRQLEKFDEVRWGYANRE